MCCGSWAGAAGFEWGHAWHRLDAWHGSSAPMSSLSVAAGRDCSRRSERQRAGRVVLIEAEPTLAGGWRVDVASNHDAGAIEALAAEAAQAGVMIMPGVVATGWYDGTVTAISDAAHLEIRADAAVAATGSYERVPLVPGADRPGVMGARTVAALVSGHDGARLIAAPVAALAA